MFCLWLFCFCCWFTDSLTISVFDGFEASNTTTDVTVRLGEAVALKCGVLGAAPAPNYVWFSDNMTIDTTIDTAKIRTLDDGATLVIYDLQSSDTAPLYSCGVTNARMFDTEISTRLYRLVETGKYMYTCTCNRCSHCTHSTWNFHLNF